MPFFNFEDIPEKEVFPGVQARFVHGESMTMAYMRIQADSQAPEHSHPHEQITNVIVGTLELTVEGVPTALSAGEVAVIPPNVRHSAKAITDCLVLDVFHPLREDYR